MRERARSASRSRRDAQRTSQSVRGSHDSAAGNLSPGRHHGRRESGSGGGGGFFKNLFGSRRHRDQSPPPYPAGYPGEPYPEPGMAPPPPPPAPASSSPAAKLRALLSFAPTRHASPGRGGVAAPPPPPPGMALPPGPGGPVELPRGATDDLTIKNLQHQMQLMQAQMQDYQTIKTQLLQEQRQAQEWREKWNFQDLKLNLMVDMLVLRVLELEQPGVYGGAPGAGQAQGR
ncbi:hypothetical protein HYH02_010922 [Chlamydomonas schloesseri]|uniref:Uncharacterized protein n=1 Tax=Chlamydomonas schloesseri TaxID=2026947 RepID=A0A835W7B6_9CHLO|nr:hypothetical protein HYH02_010922 [Chlamydomonas schloesseri]|eukprot:KAG2438221.1 hypothetical protein HYH02_010922 [Chlamydomonas schloesseri]